VFDISKIFNIIRLKTLYPLILRVWGENIYQTFGQ